MGADFLVEDEEVVIFTGQDTRRDTSTPPPERKLNKMSYIIDNKQNSTEQTHPNYYMPLKKKVTITKFEEFKSQLEKEELFGKDTYQVTK